MVPSEFSLEIHQNQTKILEALANFNNSNSTPGFVLNKYITEATAKEILGRETTWFWSQRRNGILKLKKQGTTYSTS